MSEIFETSPIVLGLNAILVWLGYQVMVTLKADMTTKATMVILLVVIFLGLNFIEYTRIMRENYEYTK